MQKSQCKYWCTDNQYFAELDHTTSYVSLFNSENSLTNRCKEGRAVSLKHGAQKREEKNESVSHDVHGSRDIGRGCRHSGCPDES
ncbi:MAG: hypothetical protein ACTSQ7_12850, partial [Alphaproteobacteria bacterium]